MKRKIILVAACSAALVALGTAPADAYPDRGSGSQCSSGPNGTVCAHMETDIGSGHIRARGAADANSGKQITILEVRFEERTTERSGGSSVSNRADNTSHVTSKGAVVSSIAGPVNEQCDNTLAFFDWQADMFYATSNGNFELKSGWHSGAC